MAHRATTTVSAPLQGAGVALLEDEGGREESEELNEVVEGSELALMKEFSVLSGYVFSGVPEAALRRAALY